MIEFERRVLANGLRVLCHYDDSTPLVSVCLSYGVGTRDEEPGRTGFAHLFEHLMFGGTEAAPQFDELVQRAGGENNAYTNQDMTVYYDVVPKDNLELILWLEADRMQHLALNPKALEVQRKVVVEEFKETCLNQPFGDVWHKLGDLAYTQHPYRVPTLGLEIGHIQEASLDDVQAFFQKHYHPGNAVLSLAGPLDMAQTWAWVEQYFGAIPTEAQAPKTYTPEPPQTERREKTVEAALPADAIFWAYHAAPRLSPDYYLDDLISDVLSEGEASRLYRLLVKDKAWCTEIDAYITANEDPGLMVIEARLSEEAPSLEAVEQAVMAELQALCEQALEARELEKILNRVEHTLVFGETSVMNKAMSLGYYELLGQPQRINEEAEFYAQITPEMLQNRAKQLFQAQAPSVLYYLRNGEEPPGGGEEDEEDDD